MPSSSTIRTQYIKEVKDLVKNQNFSCHSTLHYDMNMVLYVKKQELLANAISKKGDKDILSLKKASLNNCQCVGKCNKEAQSYYFCNIQ